MIDVREIKLSMRYPESRQEDITDAFTRGYTGAVEIGNKAIKKLEAENARLRELLEAILQCVGETKRDKGCDACPMFNGDEAGVYFNKNWCLLRPTMRELGIEVKP